MDSNSAIKHSSETIFGYTEDDFLMAHKKHHGIKTFKKHYFQIKILNIFFKIKKFVWQSNFSQMLAFPHYMNGKTHLLFARHSNKLKKGVSHARTELTIYSFLTCTVENSAITWGAPFLTALLGHTVYLYHQ